MKLAKKINGRITALLLAVTFLQVLLWVGYLTGMIVLLRGMLFGVLAVFAVLTLGLWALRGTNFFTRDFRNFYERLDPDEKRRLDAKFDAVADRQNTIFMDAYLVNYSFIVLKAIPYRDIAEVRDLSMVYGGLS